jgi:hypothetical protein
MGSLLFLLPDGRKTPSLPTQTTMPEAKGAGLPKETVDRMELVSLVEEPIK